jgi:hypothetical protein
MPVASETAEKITNLYEEGSTATGRLAGKRFPTASAKSEFWTQSSDERFAVMGLSALPVFYSESEQLNP